MKKKKNTKEEILKELDEISEVLELCRREAEFTHGLICEWASKHEDGDMDKVGIKELRREKKRGMELYSRLRINIGEMKKVDARYNELKERVNKYYGRDVLPAFPSPYIWDELLEDVGDRKDWEDGEEWKGIYI